MTRLYRTQRGYLNEPYNYKLRYNLKDTLEDILHDCALVDDRRIHQQVCLQMKSVDGYHHVSGFSHKCSAYRYTGVEEPCL